MIFRRSSHGNQTPLVQYWIQAKSILLLVGWMKNETQVFMSVDKLRYGRNRSNSQHVIARTDVNRVRYTSSYIRCY